MQPNAVLPGEGEPCITHREQITALRELVERICKGLEALTDAIKEEREQRDGLRESIHGLQLYTKDVELAARAAKTDVETLHAANQRWWNEHEAARRAYEEKQDLLHERQISALNAYIERHATEHQGVRKTWDDRLWEISKVVIGPAVLLLLGLLGAQTLYRRPLIVEEVRAPAPAAAHPEPAGRAGH